MKALSHIVGRYLIPESDYSNPSSPHYNVDHPLYDPFVEAALSPSTHPTALAAISISAIDRVRECALANPNFDPLAVVYIQSGYADSMTWDEFKAATQFNPPGK